MRQSSNGRAGEAQRISHQFVEDFKRTNPEPRGDLRVSDSDYERFEKVLAKKILEVGQQ